jgi:hypothetical protein
MSGGAAGHFELEMNAFAAVSRHGGESSNMELEPGIGVRIQ